MGQCGEIRPRHSSTSLIPQSSHMEESITNTTIAANDIFDEQSEMKCRIHL